MKAKILFFFFVSSIGSYISCHANTTANRSQSDSILIAYLNECGIQTSTENEVEILKSGHDKFIDLFEEIKKAKHHIHLEYFNFRNDSIANSLFDILEIKAKAMLPIVLEDDKKTILEYIDTHFGVIPFSENTEPEIIERVFKMSKAAFKRAIGSLYKEKKIIIEENRIVSSKMINWANTFNK